MNLQAHCLTIDIAEFTFEEFVDVKLELSKFIMELELNILIGELEVSNIIKELEIDTEEPHITKPTVDIMKMEASKPIVVIFQKLAKHMKAKLNMEDSLCFRKLRERLFYLLLMQSNFPVDYTFNGEGC
jgi:hypothetical protein